MNRIYDVDEDLNLQDRAAQVRHLALIGIASIDGIWKVRNIDDARRSLFEVIARLAGEIEDDLDGSPDLIREGTPA